MLTAKDMQDLLQVDRSTIYRMAEAKQLPSVKIGRQWRFPADQIQTWLSKQSAKANAVPQTQSVPSYNNGTDKSFAAILPTACVQLIQDSFAEAIGAMIVVTDMQGNPVTKISNPCGLFEMVEETPNVFAACTSNWGDLGKMISFEPQLIPNHFGLLGARGLVRVGTELKGMVIIGGIAPDNWPPSQTEVDNMAAVFGVPVETLNPHLDEVFYLNDSQKALALSLVQKIANILAHIITERTTFIGKLESIAELVKL